MIHLLVGPSNNIANNDFTEYEQSAEYAQCQQRSKEECDRIMKRRMEEKKRYAEYKQSAEYEQRQKQIEVHLANLVRKINDNCIVQNDLDYDYFDFSKSCCMSSRGRSDHSTLFSFINDHPDIIEKIVDDKKKLATILQYSCIYGLDNILKTYKNNFIAIIADQNVYIPCTSSHMFNGYGTRDDYIKFLAWETYQHQHRSTELLLKQLFNITLVNKQLN